MLELVTYWDPCKGVGHRLEICATKEKRLLRNQVQLGIGENVQLYFGIGQGSGKISHTCNRLIIDLWILENGDLKFTR